MRNKLIEAGVRNLHEFGYPTCNAKNILTDRVYAAFFERMLEDNKGKAGPVIDAEIDKLLAECKTANAGNQRRR